MPERYYAPERFYSYGPFELTPTTAKLLRETKQKYPKVVHQARASAKGRQPLYIRMGDPGELARKGGTGTEGVYYDELSMNAWIPEKRPGSTIIIDPEHSAEQHNTMAHELMHSILGKLPPSLYINEATAWRAATKPEDMQRQNLNDYFTAAEQRLAGQLLRYYLK